MTGLVFVVMLAMFLGISWAMRILVSRGVTRRCQREHGEEC